MADITKEGAIINGIMYRRVFRDNKNFIVVTTGPTGSGKSLSDLRKAELWYNNILKKPFPITNVTFSVEEALNKVEEYSQLSQKGVDVRGEIIICEESGTSMGNLDFQTTTAKLMNYVLQAFRSMNLVLFLNLPYFSMLNKSTRMLCHMLCTTGGIDKARGVCKIKPKFLQYNQTTGKLYEHYPVASVDGFFEKIREVEYKLPSDELRNQYEQKKSRFLHGLIVGSKTSIEMKDKKKLTPFQMQIYGLWKEGIHKTGEIAEKLGVDSSRVSHNLAYMRNKGYIAEETYRNADFEGFGAISATPEIN